MSSNIYDNDCSIIKQPVTIDEFRKEIDLLKEEIANLKKAKNDFIIDTVNFDKEDKIVEEKYRELLLYLKSLIGNPDFEENEGIEIKYESNIAMYEKIRDWIKGIQEERRIEPPNFNGNVYSDLLQYLKRRNLSFIFPFMGASLSLKIDGNLDFVLIKYNINIERKWYQIYKENSYILL